jgi:hypothetical protein
VVCGESIKDKPAAAIAMYSGVAVSRAQVYYSPHNNPFCN